MEGITMVMVAQMAEFVEEDIVAQHLRKAHEIEVKIDIILSRTAAPVGGIMLDRYPIIYKAISVRQFFQTNRQLCLCHSSQFLDLLRIGGRDIAIFRFLLLNNCKDFLLIQLEKGLCSHIRHKVRDDNRNALYRMNPYAHASGAGILSEDDFT